MQAAGEFAQQLPKRDCYPCRLCPFVCVEQLYSHWTYFLRNFILWGVLLKFVDSAIWGKDGQKEQTVRGDIRKLCTKAYGHFARRHTDTLRGDTRTLCAETYGHCAETYEHFALRHTHTLRGNIWNFAWRHTDNLRGDRRTLCADTARRHTETSRGDIRTPYAETYGHCTKTYGHFARRHRALCVETYGHCAGTNGHFARRHTGILRGDFYVIGLYNWDRMCFLTVAKWGWNSFVSGIEHASRALAEAFSRRQVPVGAPLSIPGTVHARFIVHKIAVGQALLQVLRCSPVSNIPPTFSYHLHVASISEGRAGEAW